ncbi:hypothetical protein F4677DRAFT_445905 [Hypoxylon crocopeplum]|nr:hypothetical protein F4677DRAFT_445905 [Hypoxylon crocopeplum]
MSNRRPATDPIAHDPDDNLSDDDHSANSARRRDRSVSRSRHSREKSLDTAQSATRVAREEVRQAAKAHQQLISTSNSELDQYKLAVKEKDSIIQTHEERIAELELLQSVTGDEAQKAEALGRVELDTLSTENAKQSTKISALTGDISKYQETIRELTDENSELTVQSRAKSAFSIECQHQVEILEFKCQHLTQLKGSLQDEYDAACLTRDANQNGFNDLYESYQEKESGFETQVLELEAGNKDLKDQVQVLTTKYEEDKSSLETTISNLRKENSSLSEHTQGLIDSHQKKDSEFESKRLQLEEENAKLKEKLEGATIEHRNKESNFTTEKDQFQKSNAELNKQLQDLIIGHLKKESNSETKIRELETEINGLKEQVLALETKDQENQEKESSLQTRMVELETRILELETSNTELGHQLQDLTAQYQINESSFKTRITNFETKIVELDTEISKLSTGNIRLIKRVKELENAIEPTRASFQFKLDECQDALTDVKTERDVERQESQRLRRTLASFMQGFDGAAQVGSVVAGRLLELYQKVRVLSSEVSRRDRNGREAASRAEHDITEAKKETERLQRVIETAGTNIEQLQDDAQRAETQAAARSALIPAVIGSVRPWIIPQIWYEANVPPLIVKPEASSESTLTARLYGNFTTQSPSNQSLSIIGSLTETLATASHARGASLMYLIESTIQLSLENHNYTNDLFALALWQLMSIIRARWNLTMRDNLIAKLEACLQVSQYQSIYRAMRRGGDSMSAMVDRHGYIYAAEKIGPAKIRPYKNWVVVINLDTKRLQVVHQTRGKIFSSNHGVFYAPDGFDSIFLPISSRDELQAWIS